MNREIEVILFDVGGVLCELGTDPVPTEWIPGERRFSLSDWFHSDIALAFEKGEISAEVLALEFKKDLAIRQTVEEILSEFDDWLIGPYPGTHALLDSIPAQYRLAILSNTNALHWPKISRQFGFQDRFERIFSSHLLGKAKPDPSVFSAVLRELEVLAERVLFLDDNEDNIRSASKQGLLSVRVEGIDQVRQVLVEKGLLNA